MSALNGEIILVDQGIGEPVQARLFGDEFYARRETLDGYTILYDTQQRRYCYATLAAGRFVSTGIPMSKPAPPFIRKHLQEDIAIRGEKFGLRYAQLRPAEVPPDNGLTRTLGPDGGLLTGRKLHTGHITGLTIIVDFDDIQTSITRPDVEAMFNADHYTVNGNFSSVKTYFEVISSGKLVYTNIVVGPITLAKRRSHYINNLLVEEALNQAVHDLGVDLRQFDSKGEGIVDAINILYAGESQYDGNLWPHNSFQTLQYGDMRTHYYQITGLGLHTVDLRIGTICHENGHLLCRFPDMYDYGQRDGDNERSQGIGRYCLMGSGNHLNHRRTPAPICGYLRELAGWVDTVVDLNTPGDYVAEQGRYDTVMKYSTDKPNEYFIVENRTRAGMDAHLPASGLAVLHCDTLGSNEWQNGTRNRHYQCALLQADGHLDLENNRNTGDEGDLFPTTSGVVLSHATVPASLEWDGTDSGLLIRDVAVDDDGIRFSAGASATPGQVNVETSPNAAIPDNDPRGVSSVLAVDASGNVASVSVSVEIIHGWISDLKVTLRSPAGTDIVLHNHEGRDGDDIVRTWTSDDFAQLRQLHEEDVQGDWTLHVVDTASADMGRLVHWRLALDVAPSTDNILEDRFDTQVAIPDNDEAGIATTLTQTHQGSVKNIVVSVDIEHTYIGDLHVEVVSPSGVTVPLQDKEGEWADDIHRSYDLASTPALQRLVGEPIQGDWRLRVRDLAAQDEGQLTAWGLKIWH